jgi:hypothetical protein
MHQHRHRQDEVRARGIKPDLARLGLLFVGRGHDAEDLSGGPDQHRTLNSMMVQAGMTPMVRKPGSSMNA